MPKKKSVSLAPVSQPKSGPDGTVVQTRRIRTGTQAVATHKVRCRPGTFEWRYGAKGNPQYHAGAEFAQLWERAGIASVGTGIPSLAGNSRGRPSGGLADSRVLALDRVKALGEVIGGPMQRRLVAYCVEGRTPKEIAATYGGCVTDRQMGEVLDMDLVELARAMGFAA